MNARIETLRSMALAAGWVDSVGRIIIERAAEVYAAAQQLGCTAADVDEAFGYTPGEVAAWLETAGWAPLKGSTNWLLIGGAAAAALLLLRR